MFFRGPLYKCNVLKGWSLICGSEHRQPKLNIREPLNYKALYGNKTDLCKMVKNNSVLSIKSTYPVSSCILCHLPAFQADWKRFWRVGVIRVSTSFALKSRSLQLTQDSEDCPASLT